MAKILKKIFMLCIILGICPLMSAYANDTIRIATLPVADTIVLHVAKEEGIFSKNGLEVSLIPFKSALEIGAAMKARKVEGHFGDLMNVLLQIQSGVSQKVVATTTHTHPKQRAFALMVSPKFKDTITDIKSLNHTKSAMSSATIIEYLKDRMLEKANLDNDVLDNVEVKQIQIRVQMLLSGQIETALLPEPLVSLVEARGGVAIMDDTNLNETLAVVSLNDEVLKSDMVGRFVDSLSEAAGQIESNSEKYIDLMVKKNLLPKDVAAKYKMVGFSHFNTLNNLPPLPTDDEVLSVAKWMQQKGILKSLPDDGIVFHAK